MTDSTSSNLSMPDILTTLPTDERPENAENTSIVDDGHMNEPNIVDLRKEIALKALKKVNYKDLSITLVQGRGAYSVVLLAKWNYSYVFPRRDVAMKVTNVKDEKIFMKELKIINKLNHPNVIKSLGYGTDPRGKFFLLLEIMDNGSLHSVLHDSNKSIAEHINHWSFEIAKGLKYLHGINLYHRDIKPSNILLSNNYQSVKIGDFGTGRMKRMEMENALTRNIGTIFYMAPEVFDKQDYTTQCDIYSFAITLCEIFTRKKPYFDRVTNTKTQFIIEIKKTDHSLRPSIGDAVPRFIAALIRRCWKTEANLRISIDDICNYLEVYQKRMTNQPEQQIHSKSRLLFANSFKLTILS